MDFVMGEAYGKNLDGKKTSEIDGKPVSQTLAQVSDNISQSKIDSQFGQAMGIENNMNSGVNYAENAMYGEMSNQQSTKAKLDAQGGVEGAVKIDTTEAQLKAKTQEAVLDTQLKQGGAKDGLDSSVKSLAEATSKLAQTAGTIAGGKTASDIVSISSRGGEDGYIEASKKSGIESASKMGAQYDNAKAVLDKEFGIDATGAEVGERLQRENRITEGFKAIPSRTGGGIVDAFEHFTGVDIDGDGEVAAGVAGGLVALSEIRGAGKGGGVVTKGVKGAGKGLKKATDKVRGISDETPENTTNSTNNSTSTNKDSQPKQDTVKKTEFDTHDKTSSGSKSTDSIPKNGAESKTTNSLMEALEQKSAKNEAAVMSEKMTTDDFVKNEMALDNAKEKLTSGGRIHSKELKGLGIDAKSMGLSIDEKGFVDIAKTDDGIAKAEAKLAEAKSKSQSASLETKPTAPTTPPEAPKVLPSAKKSTASQEIFQYSADLKADAQAAQARQEAFTNAQKQRDNLLSVAETPEQIAKVNADYDAKASTIKSQYPTPQERFIDRNKNPLVSTNGNPATGSSNTYLSDLFGNKSTAEGSWMKGLFEAPGGGKAKAVATVAALTAGGSLMAQDNGIVGQISSSMFNQNKNASVAANVGNAADASVEILDPTIAGYKTAKEVSKSVGANIGKGNYVAAAKDIVTSPVAFAKNVVNDGMQFGNSLHGLYSSIGQNSSVTDSMRPPIPPHVHTAFTTPTGFNSLGVNAYNNNTSNVNTTAEEYRANNNQQIADTMDNVSINTEYAQEQGSVNSELLQQIAEQTKMDE